MIRASWVLDSWRTAREDTAQAVLDMPEGDLAFQPAPDMLTFGQTAIHVLNASHALVATLLEGGDLPGGPSFRDRMQAHRVELAENAGPEALAAALRATMESDYALLAAQSDEFYAGMITKWDGAQLTRLEMVQFIKEHELVHRSQMFGCLRLKGVVPATTRRRMAQTTAAQSR